MSFKSLSEDLFDYEKSRIFYEYKILIFFMNYFEYVFAKETWLKIGVKKVAFSKKEIREKIDEFMDSTATVTKFYDHDQKSSELEWSYVCIYHLNKFGYFTPTVHNL